MYTLETNYSNQFNQINAITNNRGNNYRGNTYRFNSNRRGNFNRDNSRRDNLNNDRSQDVLRCYKCNGENHFARYCRSKNF